METILENRRDIIKKIYEKARDAETSYLLIEHKVDGITPLELRILHDESLIDN